MNREIKFRAWDKNDKRLKDVNTLGLNEGFVSTTRTSGSIEDYVLMQYTGLKDKNGKEIYESDIVKIDEGYCGDHRIKEHIAVVEWDYDGWYASELPDERWANCEVIGNLYESPELLASSKTE